MGKPYKYNFSALLKRILDDDEFINDDYKTEVTVLKEVMKSAEEFDEILEFDPVISDDINVKENFFYDSFNEITKISRIDEEVIPTFLFDCWMNEGIYPLFNLFSQIAKFQPFQFCHSIFRIPQQYASSQRICKCGA